MHEKNIRWIITTQLKKVFLVGKKLPGNPNSNRACGQSCRLPQHRKTAVTDNVTIS